MNLEISKTPLSICILDWPMEEFSNFYRASSLLTSKIGAEIVIELNPKRNLK
jgi:hypothetical protein